MSIESYIKDLNNLPEPRETFMEIMKVHQSEVHVANLLAYFFRSEEKHGLGKLFIKTILTTNSFQLNKTSKENHIQNSGSELIKHSWNLQLEDDSLVQFSSKQTSHKLLGDLTRVFVKTEEKTEKTSLTEKRIDLVLKTDECIICIEFKINHDLDNPLKTYQSQIKEIERKSQTDGNKPRDLFFIILTPFKKKPSDSVQNFINEGSNKFREMILGHFINNLVKNIPKDYFMKNFENSDSFYLIELIQTIKNREIRYKRGEVLKDLNNHLGAKLNGKYYSTGRSGGFIQIQLKNTRYKIRFRNNHQFQIEKWSSDNLFLKKTEPIELDNSDRYLVVAKKISEFQK